MSRNKKGPPRGPTQLRYDPDLDASAGTLYWLAHDDHLGETVGRRVEPLEIVAWLREQGVVVIEGEISQERYFTDVEFATVIRRLMDIFDPSRADD